MKKIYVWLAFLAWSSQAVLTREDIESHLSFSCPPPGLNSAHLSLRSLTHFAGPDTPLVVQKPQLVTQAGFRTDAGWPTLVQHIESIVRPKPSLAPYDAWSALHPLSFIYSPDHLHTFLAFHPLVSFPWPLAVVNVEVFLAKLTKREKKHPLLQALLEFHTLASGERRSFQVAFYFLRQWKEDAKPICLLLSRPCLEKDQALDCAQETCVGLIREAMEEMDILTDFMSGPLTDATLAATQKSLTEKKLTLGLVYLSRLAPLQGRPINTYSILGHSVSKFPMLAEAWFLRGNLHLMSGHYKEAALDTTKAANLKYPPAQAIMAHLLIDNAYGMETNLEAAERLAHDAAHQGDGFGQFYLACVLSTNGQFEEAIRWGYAALRQGIKDPNLLKTLYGALLPPGALLTDDEKRDLTARLTTPDASRAHYQLGLHALRESNPYDALFHLHLASQEGVAEAHFQMGHLCRLFGKYEAALSFFEKAREGKVPRALAYMGAIEACEFPTRPMNEAKALSHYLTCYEEEGDLESCFNAGMILYQGKKVAPEKIKAYGLLARAAQGGYAAAQYQWGAVLCEMGNDKEGVEWVVKSFHQNFSLAKSLLARMHVTLTPNSPAP